MVRKPTFRGRELSPEELEEIRRDIELFDTIDVVDDENHLVK